MNQTSSLADFLRHFRQLDSEDVFSVKDELHRAAASDAATAAHQVLYPDLVRLLGIVESLAVACVLAAVLAGCASPAARDPRDTALGSSAAEASAVAGPRFAQGGPDAEDYGASSGYPVGDRTSCPRPAFLVGCHSHFDQVYEGRLVRRATTPSPLARAASEPPVRYEYQGQTFTLNDYLARNPATGLLVARGDTILIERYQYARNDRHRFTSWSMAKTVTAMLIGIAIAEGRIRSVDDPAAAYVPALGDTEYGRTSLRQLLQMSSGVRFIEEYTGKDDVSRLAADTFRQVGTGGVEAVTPFNVRIAPSGTRFYYASVETQALGLVLRNAVGRPVADYLQKKIWEPIGAEADATWLIDRAGQEAAYCCINAVLRDYARLGLLLAHDGHWRGRQIISADWIKEATIVRPGQPQPSAGGYAIRSGYWGASGGCSRSAASAARRSTSTRRAGSSWSTRRSEDRPAIQVSERQTRSGAVSCNSSAIDPRLTRVGRICCGVSLNVNGDIIKQRSPGFPMKTGLGDCTAEARKNAMEQSRSTKSEIRNKFKWPKSQVSKQFRF
jgi:CubicO group peptidase (beta-lactamase class C family)